MDCNKPAIRIPINQSGFHASCQPGRVLWPGRSLEDLEATQFSKNMGVKLPNFGMMMKLLLRYL